MSNELSEWTSFGIGGRAKRLSVAHTRGELIKLAPDALVLGRGTNVLVSDSGYDGSVVINRCGDIAVIGDTVVADSGAPLCAVARAAAINGLTGLEWAYGIPGSLGGAVRMNAGAYGGCVADVLLYADVLRGGNVERLDARGLGLSYRCSALAPADTVVSARLMLKRGDKRIILGEIARLTALRAQKMPSGKSAGSIFKNPEGIKIAREIEAAGLKGSRRGGAVISQKHANVIVNLGGAKARDVVYLINSVKTALAERGVTAEEEITYIGEF